MEVIETINESLKYISNASKYIKDYIAKDSSNCNDEDLLFSALALLEKAVDTLSCST